jgi:hypothetical protein
MTGNFFNNFFWLNLKDYDNIKIDFPINAFLLFLAVAIAVASVIITLYRGGLQKLIKQLTRYLAKDEKNARTLAELGLEKSFIVKLALSREGRLTRLVGRVGETVLTYEEALALSKEKKKSKPERIDFETARFYIRPERGDEAKNIIENYSASMFRTALYCVLVFALYVCIALLMPEILNFINSSLAG